MDPENSNDLIESLNLVENYKNDISNVLNIKGENIENIPFEQYPNIVANFDGKVSNIKSNLPTGNNIEILNQATRDSIAYKMNSTNIENVVWVNKTNNSVDILTGYNYGLLTPEQYVFEGSFIGRGGTLYQGKLGFPFEGDNENITACTNFYSRKGALENLYISLDTNLKDLSNLFTNRNDDFVVPYIDTRFVTNMSSMFSNSSVEVLPNLMTANVTDMSSMFYNCQNLITVPNFRLASLNNTRSMFTNCINLKVLPNFYINKNKTIHSSHMFRECYCLTSISFLNDCNVTDPYSMFKECHNIKNVPNLTILNYTYLNNTYKSEMDHFCYNCYNLINIPEYDMSNVDNLENAFRGCTNLVDVPQFNISDITDKANIAYMFSECNNLSDASIQNIINMCLNSNISNGFLYNNAAGYLFKSIFYNTNIENIRYQNRWDELTAKGWRY